MPIKPLRAPLAARPALALAALLAVAAAALPTRAQEGVSPGEALARLKAGNERFVSGALRPKSYAAERTDLVAGQQPYAVVLACADSRVAPEILFDESLGRLFVVRVAGNVADPVVLGSIEYAVEHLHTNLLFVLGHENCGAVKAALAGGEASANIGALVRRIEPAAERARVQKLDASSTVAAAVRENVRYQVHMALFESDVLREFVHQRKLQIAGGVYSLQTGAVEVVSAGVSIDGPPAEAHAGGEHASPVDEAGPAAVEKDRPEADFAQKVREAYESKAEVYVMKSLLMRDENDRCAPFDCVNIPAGSAVQVASPLVVTVGGRPQLRLKYKGKFCYVPALEEDFSFTNVFTNAFTNVSASAPANAAKPAAAERSAAQPAKPKAHAATTASTRGSHH
jgi:carbonic anhydrase